MAYNPNPLEEDHEDPRQSWQEGDDFESILANPPTQPPPKPPKLPQDRHAAPQLPPLYFESQPQVEQKDFAYQKPITLNAQEATASSPPPGSYVARSDSETIPNVSYLALRLVTRDEVHPRLQHPSPSQQSQPRDSARKSPPNPVKTTSAHHETQRDSRNETRGNEGHKTHREPQKINIPRHGKSAKNDTAEETNESFFFDSPQSSNGALDESPKAVPNGDVGAASSKTPNTVIGLSSASALGFGGPSDWEHFGDYDAEEIDDEDLYVSSKAKTAELPAGSSPQEERSSQPTANSMEQIKHEPSVPASTQEGKQDQAVDESEPVPTHIALDIPSHTPHAAVLDDELAQSPSVIDSTPVAFNESQDVPMVSAHGESGNRASYAESTNGIRPPLRGETLVNDEPYNDVDAKSKVDNLPEDTFREGTGGDEVEQNQISDSRGPVDDEQVTSEGSQNVIACAAVGLAKHGIKPNDNPNNAISQDALDSREVAPTMPSQRAIRQNSYDSSLGHGDDVGEDIIISLDMHESPPETMMRSEPQRDISLDGISSSLPASTNRLEPMRRSPPENKTSKRRSVLPNSVELLDPYENLEAWAKASLNRYITMLHEEALAETEEQKYSIFTNFTRKETRLRAVLYDMDDPPESSSGPAIKQTIRELRGAASVVTLRPSIKSKALPALPQGAQRSSPSPVKEPSKRLETVLRSTGRTDSQPQQKNENNAPSKVKQASNAAEASILRGAQDESYVMVESPATEQNEPVATAIIPPIAENGDSSPLKTTSSLTSLRKALDVVGTRLGASSSTDSRSTAMNTVPASIISEMKSSETPRSNSVPLPSMPDTMAEPSHTGIEKPAYTPLRYNEGRPYEGDKASNRQSIYMPFAGLLRESSQRQGSFQNGFDPQRKTSRRGEGLSVNTNSQKQIQLEETGSSAGETPVKPPNPRYSILQPLLNVIPVRSVSHLEPAQIVRVRQQSEAIEDKFTFIHETVVAWHAEMKHVQELHDKERHARQGESEQRIDALFNDNEIGYGDISELEAEFKRSEASRKAEEDRAEYQSFVAKVFEVVWARLHYEMDQLTPLYDICTQMLYDATAGKDMFDDNGDGVPIAPAMDVLLILYEKLDIRHQKAFEAVLERDRRLMKTELAPWYALGNVVKAKKIKERFEEAEKKAILEFCRQRDERANLLMDVLDQNTLRGVGSNQDYMESIMQAIRKIALDVALSGADKDPTLSTDEVVKAKTITAALATSSEQIVQTFHVADMRLNSADYEVSVANARILNADAAAFKRLREAKAKEDQKLVKDLEHRMSLIRGDTSRTQDEIAKLMSLLGSSASDATPTRSTSAPADPEREARLLAALEEAKRRNAGQEGGAGPGFKI